ncbi:MAG: AzlC family ABC transporter permease [Lachnospiraceae bacterium]|nr:AzlC family ABC transporter permease [Lachnospiraceae bacterium]
MIRPSLIKKAFIKTLPVMAGYIVLGIGFGILLEKNGYGLPWAFFMSLLIYAGSMQYVGVSLLTSGASVIMTAITTLMVNARHLFYGISMIEKYKGAGAKKPYLMFALTDETYALVSSPYVPEDVNPHTWYTLISLMDQFYWVLGSVIGSLLGSAITFNTAGIDFSMTALFVTIVVEQWLTSRDHTATLIGAAVSVICLVIFGPSNFLIPAMIGITLALTVSRPFIEQRAEKKEQEEKTKEGQR